MVGVIDMYFDYSLYVDVCLIEACQGFVLCVLGFIILITYFIEKSRKEDLSIVYCAFFAFIIMGNVIGILQCGGKLIHGINLIKEKEEDAVEIYGEISNKKGINDFTRRLVGDKYGYDEISGTIFTIDGIKCTAPLNCGLEVGDYVTVRYLPKSGYILYISKTDDS